MFKSKNFNYIEIYVINKENNDYKSIIEKMFINYLNSSIMKKI